VNVVIGIVANTLFRLASEGKPEAMSLVRQPASHFGVGLASLVNALNPQRIIVWGDLVNGALSF